jgi:hypothetical protein
LAARLRAQPFFCFRWFCAQGLESNVAGREEQASYDEAALEAAAVDPMVALRDESHLFPSRMACVLERRR